MGVCTLFSEAYLRNHPKADEKQIETQIAATLKQAPLQKKCSSAEESKLQDVKAIYQPK